MVFLLVYNFSKQSFGWFYYTGNATSEKCLHVQFIFLFNDWTLQILLERKTIRFCKHILCKIMNFRALHFLGECCTTSVTAVALCSVSIFKKLFNYSFIQMCIHCLGHLYSLSSSLLTSRQNLFCPYLWFCWREDIRIIRKTKCFY
jgi:hypothetical protein